MGLLEQQFEHLEKAVPVNGGERHLSRSAAKQDQPGQVLPPRPAKQMPDEPLKCLGRDHVLMKGEAGMERYVPRAAGHYALTTPSCAEIQVLAATNLYMQRLALVSATPVAPAAVSIVSDPDA